MDRRKRSICSTKIDQSRDCDRLQSAVSAFPNKLVGASGLRRPTSVGLVFRWRSFHSGKMGFALLMQSLAAALPWSLSMPTSSGSKASEWIGSA